LATDVNGQVEEIEMFLDQFSAKSDDSKPDQRLLDNGNSSYMDNDGEEVAVAKKEAVKTAAVACARRGCKVRFEPLIKCAAAGCNKHFHASCFKEKYANKHWDRLQPGMVVCTKRCYDRYAAIFTKKLTWKTDGKMGPQDPQNSEKLLLEWMLCPGNYSLKWRGKENNGMTKQRICEFIAESINKSGVLERRNAKQVQSKIEHLESQFRRAADFATGQTGAGLLETDKAGFDNAILDKCSLYFDLLPVMGDRAMARPKATSNDNLESSSESSNSNHRKPPSKIVGRLPQVINVANSGTRSNRHGTLATVLAHKTSDSLSLSPRKPKASKILELEQSPHMVGVAESKVRLNKAKQQVVRKELEQQQFATEESKIALEKKRLN
jgi:hypothetical protein